MRTRATFILMTVAVAIFAVACGRASQQQINAALHITPTATFSAAVIASSTAASVAEATNRAALIASFSSPGSASPASFAAAGDVVQGQSQFTFRCQTCHQPAGGGRGPSLAGPNNPATKLTDEQFVNLIRTGKGHSSPPGSYSEVDINDQTLINIIAYIRSQSK